MIGQVILMNRKISRRPYMSRQSTEKPRILLTWNPDLVSFRIPHSGKTTSRHQTIPSGFRMKGIQDYLEYDETKLASLTKKEELLKRL